MSVRQTSTFTPKGPPLSQELIPEEATILPGVISNLPCCIHTVRPATYVTVCVSKKSMCAFFMFTQSHTERSIPTRLKKRCPEVGCPFPTSSPFQRLEIPLCTKRPDMIPQHCRQGRELGTVLIRQALLSGKILKGMQPIVVNCMGPHSIPSAAGMCYLS